MIYHLFSAKSNTRSKASRHKTTLDHLFCSTINIFYSLINAKRHHYPCTQVRVSNVFEIRGNHELPLIFKILQ